MAQLLIDLNTYEVDFLEQEFGKNNFDCSIRFLYDHTFDKTLRQRCAIEGKINEEVLDYIKKNYSSQIQSDLRFVDA